MEALKNLVCPTCGADTGQPKEKWIAEKVFSLVCKKCGTKIRISSLHPRDVLRGYPDDIDK